jgi:hypothetical protein
VGTWYGWIRIARKWERMTGPHGRLGEAAAALDDEVGRRGLLVSTRDLALTSGGEPPDTAAPPPGVAQDGRDGGKPAPAAARRARVALSGPGASPGQALARAAPPFS